MEFEKLPVGFAMSLAQNRAAMENFASMSDDQKRALLNRAHRVHSKREVQQIVSALAGRK